MSDNPNLVEMPERPKRYSTGVDSSALYAYSCDAADVETYADDMEAQLLAAKQMVETVERRNKRFRVRMFSGFRAKGSDHTTACSIWGDDGQGGTEEGYTYLLPCNCGALENYYKVRAERAEALTEEMAVALRAAKMLIANGHELGFIRMPDEDCSDPAHLTLGIIDASLESFRKRKAGE